MKTKAAHRLKKSELSFDLSPEDEEQILAILDQILASIHGKLKQISTTLGNLNDRLEKSQRDRQIADRNHKRKLSARNGELSELAHRIQKLDHGERKQLARILRGPRLKKSKQTEKERIDQLEREYYAAHPDIPVDRELLALVGTVPDDGKTIAEVVMEGYERSQRS